MKDNEKFINEAIQEALKGIQANHGGPFGCVIVKDGEIIGRGHNRVTSTNDPSAHAEVVAIREACTVLNTFQLKGCELYTSCEPCPMCLGAIYWARPDKVYYASTKDDAAAIGFDDAFIYIEITLPDQERTIPFEKVHPETALLPFQTWTAKENKIEY